MRLRHQRALYLTFMAIFAVLVPLLILSATGYRYNFKKHRLEKTGILMVESALPRADVSVNNEYRGQTPIRLTALVPDTYRVRVSSNGFFNWNKDIDVISGQTSFTGDVVLFRDTAATPLTPGVISLVSSDIRAQRMVYALPLDATTQVRSVDLRTRQDQLLVEMPRKNGSVVGAGWSASGNFVSIQVSATSSTSFLIAGIETGERIELSSISRLPYSRLVWDARTDGVVYGMHANVVSRIDLVTRTSRTLLSGAIADLQAQGDAIYYLTDQPDGALLHRRAANDADAPEEKIKLPEPSGYRFLPSPTGFLTILGPAGKDSLVMSTQAFGAPDPTSQIVAQEPAKQIHWTTRQDKFLLVNDYELAVIEPTSRSRETITRYGQPLERVFWHPSGEWIFYALGGQFKVIEISGKTKNDLLLATFVELRDAMVDPIGQFAYINGVFEKEEGLFRLELR